MRRSRVALALAFITAASAGAQEPPEPLPRTTVIHAGELLDRPGQKPRGNSSIIIEDGKIVEVRDGFVPPPADARVVDLKNQFGRGGRIGGYHAAALKLSARCSSRPRGTPA